MKKSPEKKAKDKAWKVFSQYIRRRNANKEGYTRCVTCYKLAHYKELQAGHYVDGRNMTVLFDERLVHPQCFKCNMKGMGCLGGNKIKYTKYMMDTYGYTIEQLDEFDNLKFKVNKMSISDFAEIEDKYSDLLVGLDMKGLNYE